MKLENVTDESRQASRDGSKRWYDDACGTALAMELVGERWSLLIVRELMFGPRRFGEIKAGLPGISANVLTQRLAGLETANILFRHTLPPPANVQVYELTAWGYESEPAIQALGRWAVRSPAHDPTLPLSPASLMLSFRTIFSAELAGDLALRIGFRFGPETFVVTVADGTLTVQRREPVDAEVRLIAAAAPIVAAAVYGKVPLAALEADGVLTVEGDRALVERFVDLFVLPPKIG